MKVVVVLQYDSKLSKFAVLSQQQEKYEFIFVILQKPHHFFNIFGHDHDIQQRIAQVHLQLIKNLENSIELQFKGHVNKVVEIGNGSNGFSDLIRENSSEMIVIEREHEMLADVIKISSQTAVPMLVV